MQCYYKLLKRRHRKTEFRSTKKNTLNFSFTYSTFFRTIVVHYIVIQKQFLVPAFVCVHKAYKLATQAEKHFCSAWHKLKTPWGTFNSHGITVLGRLLPQANGLDTRGSEYRENNVIIYTNWKKYVWTLWYEELIFPLHGRLRPPSFFLHC